MYKLLLFVILLSFCQCKRDHSLKEEVTDLLRAEIIIRGDKALAEEPVTITAYKAERSAGSIHDFYSEGDYWWPNPVSPDSAYIRRDGQTNPDNFVAHRHAMIRFSSLIGDLTSAWLVTKDEKYIRQAVKHVRAWFVDPETRMNPNLQYAQAIKGIVTGRGIGIIDTIPSVGGRTIPYSDGTGRRLFSRRCGRYSCLVFRLPEMADNASLRGGRDEC